MIPTVSIIIPCYNGERWVGEAIRSVKIQTYPYIQTIVVNDGSTDGSVNEIRKWENVMLINHEKNRGVCCAANTGFDAATSTYAGILAADDVYIDPEHISRQVREMERHNLDWCYNSCNLRGETLQTATKAKAAWLTPPVRHAAHIFRYLDNVILMYPRICYLLSGIRNPVNSSTMMIRMKTYKNKKLSWNPWDLKSVCDGGLIATMFLNGLKCRAIPECDAFYRIHKDQISNKPINSIAMKDLVNNMYSDTVLRDQPIWMKISANLIKSYLTRRSRR